MERIAPIVIVAWLVAPPSTEAQNAPQDVDAGASDAAPAPDGAAAPQPEPDLAARIAALEAQLAALQAQPHAGGGSDEAQANQRLGAENAAELTGGASAAPHTFTLGGYAEALYQWNFNQPSNGITNYRGFDNRHDTFTVSNVALDAQWDFENVVGRVALQVGHTPDSYYLAEPSRAGSAAAGATGAPLWKFVQQAYAGYRFPVGRGLLVQAGIFLSPIGPEGMQVKDNWNWSRSNLFFGLPFYHTGVRASYPVNDEWTLTLAAYNGWNSVVDNNESPSVSAQATYTHASDLAVSLIYFGGVERSTGAPEGPYWRNLFDAYATWTVSPWLSLLAHADAGFEPNRFGTSSWAAGAVYARVQPVSWLFVTARGDFFYEGAASNAGGTAARIFWPVPVDWVSSGTLTLEARPHDRVSIRLEYRHDHASGNLYFAGNVATDATGAYVPNHTSQDTVTLGITTWF